MTEIQHNKNFNRNLSSLILASVLAFNATIVGAHSKPLLKAETPSLDERQNFLVGRVEILLKAKGSEKLPLNLSSSKRVAKIDLQKQDPTLIGGAQKTDNHLATKVTRTTLTVAPHSPLKNNRVAGKSASSNLRSALVEKLILGPWGGYVTKTAGEVFRTDPTRSLKVDVGERGLTVLRCTYDNGESMLHPPSIFFTGRATSASQAVHQRQRSNDPFELDRPVSALQGFMANLKNLFQPSPPDTAATSPFEFVYLNCGTTVSYNRDGKYFMQNVTRSTGGQVGSNRFIQEFVVTDTTNDSSSPLAFKEVVMDFKLKTTKDADVQIILVNYTADRQIIDRQIFSGKVSTAEYNAVADRICELTKKTWSEVAEENDL